MFAIRNIPKGTYIFEPDDDELVTVRAEKITPLSSEVQELYTDFCVLNSDVYQCPQSFNRLTPSWFLNTAKTPNAADDKDLKFYAIRDIQAGDELTVDYTTYNRAPLTAEQSAQTHPRREQGHCIVCSSASRVYCPVPRRS